MENASKALVIAGAILLAILLISVALLIFNSTKGTTNQAVASGDFISLEATIAKIDMQFSKYEGIQSGETVKQLFYDVADYNANNGSYQGDETTTNYERKIAISVSNRIIGKETNVSSAGIDTIEKIYDNQVAPYINAGNKVLVTMNKSLPKEHYDYIYWISVNPVN